MPMADTMDDHGRLLRVLCYGRDKTKKTWWCAKAAEAGFNVILLDGDDRSSIIKQIPIAARKKILIVNAVNTRTRAVFSLFMASFMRPGNTFYWDEERKVSLPDTVKRIPEKSYIYFDTNKLTANDVLIIDSWTALAASTLLQYASEQEIDLMALEKEGDQFALLNFQSRFLDYCLNQIHTMPCHVFVIGHETIYEKWEGKGKDRKMISSEIVPISSTGPHAKKLSKHFEVLHFSKISSDAFRIDAGGDKDKPGGSSFLAPKKYNWDDISPKTLLDAVGSKATGEPCQGAIYLPKQKGEQNANLTLKNNATAGNQSTVAELIVNPPTENAVSQQTPLVVNAESNAGKGLSFAERIALKKQTKS